jgi:hypothetical protein
MPRGNVEELLCGIWLVMAELMHQGSTVHVGPEHQEDVDITDPGELMALLGEAPDVIPQGFALLLSATVQIPRIVGPHVRALEVSSEDLLEILSSINRASRQVIEPSPGHGS